MRSEDVRYRVGGDNALLRLVIFQQWQERCYWCDEPKIYVDIQLDHIIAHTVSRTALEELITQHGLAPDFDVHSPANLAPICGRCNREKSDRRFTGTLLSGKLNKAGSKRNAVEREVRRFSDANRAWKNAELFDLEPASTVEILERTRRLHERVQEPGGLWQIDHRTTPDGLAVIFTPRSPEVGLPPIFVFPVDEPSAARAQAALTEVVEYGGEVAIAGRYLTPAAENSPSWAQVFGLSGPDDEVVISTGQVQLDPAAVFHLAVITQSGIVRNRLALIPGSVRPGLRGTRVHLRDPCGVFNVQSLIQTEGGRTSVVTNLTANPMAGRFPYEVRSTLDLFRDAEPTDTLDIRLNDRSVGVPVDDDSVALGQALVSYRRDAETIAALDRVQAHVGDRFPLPDCITAAERDDIIKAAWLLEGRTIRVPGMIFAATVFADHVHNFLELIRQQPDGDLVLADADYQISCGQHRLDIGRVAVRLPRAVIANLDETKAVIGSGTDVPVRLRARDGQGAEVRLMEFNGQDLTLPAR